MLFNKHKKKFIAGAVLLLIAAIIYSFLWGRSFPFSPIIISFEQKELNKAIIYYHKGTNITKFNIVDELVTEVENSHQLKYKRKIKIFICDSNKEIARLTGCSTRFNTHPLYGRIFISGKAKKEYQADKIHLDVYLKHELSHSLLYQNMGLYQSLYYPGWLMEGIAVYNANQMGVDGYFTKEETFDKIENGYFLNPDDWGTILKSQKESVKNFPLTNKYWFIYSEFACLVDDLIENYGEEKFIGYMTELLKEKNDKKLFQDIFGIEFNKYLDDFKNRVGYNNCSHKNLNLK